MVEREEVAHSAPPPVPALVIRMALVLVLLALAGCRAAEPPPLDRDFIVHHPASAGNGAPLVVVLHGGFGSGAQARQAYGWDRLADQEGFVVAYPDGHGRSWNAGPSCCGPANRQGSDDAAFLHDLARHLSRTDGVDLKRVYAVGMSNGAMMSYAWACAYPGDLAGIGPVAGARIADECTPGKLTVVAVHGTADENVPIDGGVGPAGTTGVAYRSLSESLQPFLGSCQAQTTSDGPVHTTRWPCAEVTSVVIDGGGHQWPGSPPPGRVGELLGRDVPYPGLDATAFIWARFEAVASR